MYFIIFITSFIVYKIYQKYTCGICTCDTKITGKVVIVTGANTGIGFETAKNLAERGARVILACRDVVKGTTARDKIKTSTGSDNVVFKQLDLTSFTSVRKFSEDILSSESKLDILINNAGTGKLDNSLTEDNLPIEAQVNHFSPFLLTNLLLPLLKTSSPSRIINVTSIMHKLGKIEYIDKPASNFFEHMRVYSNTKLANVLFTRKLSNDLKGTGVTVNCLHPGAVSTDIFRNRSSITRYLISLVFKTPLEGAQTSIHLAVSPELSETTGKYFSDCRDVSPSKGAQDESAAKKLWELSEKVVSHKKTM